MLGRLASGRRVRRHHPLTLEPVHHVGRVRAHPQPLPLAPPGLQDEELGEVASLGADHEHGPGCLRQSPRTGPARDVSQDRQAAHDGAIVARTRGPRRGGTSEFLDIGVAPGFPVPARSSPIWVTPHRDRLGASHSYLRSRHGDRTPRAAGSRRRRSDLRRDVVVSRRLLDRPADRRPPPQPSTSTPVAAPSFPGAAGTRHDVLRGLGPPQPLPGQLGGRARAPPWPCTGRTSPRTTTRPTSSSTAAGPTWTAVGCRTCRSSRPGRGRTLPRECTTTGWTNCSPSSGRCRRR